METYVVELEGTELNSFALTVPRATRSVDTRHEYRRIARACPVCGEQGSPDHPTEHFFKDTHDRASLGRRFARFVHRYVDAEREQRLTQPDGRVARD